MEEHESQHKQRRPMWTQVLNNTPNEYINIIELMERKIGIEDEPITLHELRDKLSTKYQCIIRMKNVKKKNSTKKMKMKQQL